MKVVFKLFSMVNIYEKYVNRGTAHSIHLRMYISQPDVTEATGDYDHLSLFLVLGIF